MDGQDHKMTASSTGHEGHGVHLCYRCGWPFPNPHPSAKHRRAHKKVCGTIEGYKIIHSEENDHHLAVSDDEHASNEDEHTPTPNLMKKTSEEFGSSGGVGEKSNKSEDDVFSDAVTEFSDSGTSPRLEGRFESVRGLDKSMEQKSLEDDLYGSESLNVDATSDTTDQVNDPIRSEEMSNPGTLVNTNNQSETVIPITDTSAGRASVGLITDFQTDLVESEILRAVAVDNISEYGNGGSVEGQMKDKSAYITLESEEGRISADESKEKLSDELVSEVKHETENLQNMDASAGVESVAHYAGISGESMQTSVFATEQSEAKPVVSSADIEVKQKTSLAGGEIAGNFDASEGDKCDMGGDEDRNLEESKDNFSFAFSCGEDDQSMRAFEKDVKHGEGNSRCKLSGTRNEKGEGASVEVQVMLDSTMPLNDSTDIPSSCEAATDAADLHESSKTESSSPEFRDNGFDKPFEGLGTGNDTKAQQSVVSADLNHDIDDRKYSPTSTLEDTVSPVISEPPNNIHVTSNVVGVESVDVAGIMPELKYSSDVAASEGTPELQRSKECTSKNSANDGNICIISEGAAGASESIDAAQVCANKLNNHDGDDEYSESTNPRGQEALKEKCSVTPSLKEPVPSPLIVRINSNETCATNSIIIVDDDVIAGANSKSLQDEVDDKMTSLKVGVAAMDLSANNSSSRSDSLEGNCGSVSDTLETDPQKPKATTEEAHPDKSDTFEPPSFMTLVQSGGEGNHQVTAVSEIKSTHNNQQQPKSDALEAGWFPSLTNVSNESEGRKKNEEIIAKVTNWGPVKQHGPLKTLLNEVKSPNTKQVKDETDESKDDGAAVTSVVVGPKDQENTNKDLELWNSPVRYPIEITKEKKKKKKKKKKKGKSYWVPFVCCSSVHKRPINPS